MRFAQGHQLLWWKAKLLILITDKASMNAPGRQIGLESTIDFESRTSLCAGHLRGGVYSHPDAHFIRTATVFIPNIKSTLFSRCAVDEFTQILGLPDDILLSAVTRSNERLDCRPKFTISEELFLRILLNPVITPGLAGEELRALAVPLIEGELLRNPDLTRRPDGIR